jgi:hypothetical protein
MQKWEYKTILRESTDYGRSWAPYGSIDTALEAFGNDGWELVAISARHVNTHIKYELWVFKRPKP